MLLARKNKDRHYENTIFTPPANNCYFSIGTVETQQLTAVVRNVLVSRILIHLPNESLNSGILKLKDVEFGEVGMPIETCWPWSRCLV